MARKGVIGLTKALKRIEGFEAAFADQRMEPILLQAAKMVAERAAANAPVRTGKLRDSLRSWVGTRKAKNPAALAAVDRKIAPHAYLVEYGTQFAAAHPYFRPALAEMRGPVRRLLKTELKRLVAQRSMPAGGAE